MEIRINDFGTVSEQNLGKKSVPTLRTTLEINEPAPRVAWLDVSDGEKTIISIRITDFELKAALSIMEALGDEPCTTSHSSE